MIFAITGAIIFSAIAVLTVLVAMGFPLGEFTMGGQYNVLPKKFRIMAAVSLLIQIFAVIIILQAGGVVPLFFSARVTRNICFFFAAYLSLNTLMNLSSRSKKEKYAMTPLSLTAAICYFITAFQM
jgi:hypothetical protein